MDTGTILVTCMCFHSIFVTNVIGQKGFAECGTRFLKCCVGYTWSMEEEKCILCPPGYSGPNCSLTCPYPLFGYECQKICECEEVKCNVSNGCPKETTTEKSTQDTFPHLTDNISKSPAAERDDQKVVASANNKVGIPINIVAITVSVFVCVIVINNTLWILKMRSCPFFGEKKKIQDATYQEQPPQDPNRSDYLTIIHDAELYSGAANVCLKLVRDEEKYVIEICKAKKADEQYAKQEENIGQYGGISPQDVCYEEPI